MYYWSDQTVSLVIRILGPFDSPATKSFWSFPSPFIAPSSLPTSPSSHLHLDNEQHLCQRKRCFSEVSVGMYASSVLQVSLNVSQQMSRRTLRVSVVACTASPLPDPWRESRLSPSLLLLTSSSPLSCMYINQACSSAAQRHHS